MKDYVLITDVRELSIRHPLFTHMLDVLTRDIRDKCVGMSFEDFTIRWEKIDGARKITWAVAEPLPLSGWELIKRRVGFSLVGDIENYIQDCVMVRLWAGKNAPTP